MRYYTGEFKIMPFPWEEGVDNYKLKIAKVITLHEKGSTDNPSNYRPITLLSIFSKIFEKEAS